MRPSLRTAVAAVALTAVLAACGGGDDGGVEATPVGNTVTTTTKPTAPEVPVPEAAVEEVAVTIPGGEGEYHLETDLTSIEAGPVRFTVTNHGELEHQAMVLRYAEGADFAAFAGAAASDPTGAAALRLVEGFGGPNVIAPGETGSATSVLEPGRYMLICVLPGADKVPHAAKGMLHEFTVTEPGDGEAETELGAHDGHEIGLVDFAFVGDTTFEAGETVRVTNKGKQGHELAAYRLDDGATVEDLIAAEVDPSKGPKPTSAGSGLGIIAPGRSADFTLPDEPGSYALVCFVPDVAGDGTPHFELGMATEVTVE